ncbi:hypothetical protein Lal_00030162 [Lupinus albus]|nr:hypothetical protein Lal_00030162 [Lupinus albus]
MVIGRDSTQSYLTGILGFQAMHEGFEFCKHVFQVDGTFVTGKYIGTLLIASSQDRNRRIFLVVFAIVERETKEACEGTSLLDALRIELPQWCNAQSVSCIRHLASNFNKEL